ncbi:hypothetical protein GRF29_28g2361656 [Pseudopithomyces chartarum]|uniref:Cupin type-1 domain-containing protein n=1 Tax=Pseudopithomyces chartarum TaxID=1892770 RepID=A0AAN6M3W6_9PLEO|nr:hypothetical protein GRF29_28g2361656 [Pseudopithomyces chartarum]
MATTKLPDPRPEPTTIFDGQERKYFPLTHAQDGPHRIPILPHHHLDRSLPCKVYLPHDPRCTRAVIEAFPAYAKWLASLAHNLRLQSEPSHAFAKTPFLLKAIDLQAPTWFPGDRNPTLRRRRRRPHPLHNYPVPHPPPELYTLLTLQPRLPTTSLSFPELPAGMLDSSGNLSGKAASELREELGLTVAASSLFDMTAAAVSSVPQLPYLDSPTPNPGATTTSSTSLSERPPEHVAPAMYPSPGGCDESLSLMLLQKRMRREQIERLRGREGGVREEGEVIRLDPNAGDTKTAYTTTRTTSPRHSPKAITFPSTTNPPSTPTSLNPSISHLIPSTPPTTMPPSPSPPPTITLNRTTSPKSYTISPTPLIPNSPHPLLHYPSLLFPTVSAPNFTCTTLYDLYRSNGWTPQWVARYGATQPAHYHSTAHEVMVVIAGEGATIRFGVADKGGSESSSSHPTDGGNGDDTDAHEPGGITLTAHKGDVFIVPAGVAHKTVRMRMGV